MTGRSSSASWAASRARSCASRVRCPFGAPAVTVQSPYDSAGDPFPTTFYLTCRHLVAAVSRLEAAGGIERWSELAAGDEELAREPRARRRRSSASSAVSWRTAGSAAEDGVARSRHRRHRQSAAAEVPARPRRVRARAPRIRARRTDLRRDRAELAGSVLHARRPWVRTELWRAIWKLRGTSGRRATAVSRASGSDPDDYETLLDTGRGRHRGAPEAHRGAFHARAARRRLRRETTAGCTRPSPNEPTRPGWTAKAVRRAGRGIPSLCARRDRLHAVSTVPRVAQASQAAAPVVLGWLIRIAAAVIVFGIGVAVGQALEDRPEPSTPVTSVRTIQPWTQTNRGRRHAR